MVYEPTLWHPNQDSPEDDVEGGGVLKENLEAEEGEKLHLTTQFSIDPVRGQKQEDQAMQGTKDACKSMQKNGKEIENSKNQVREISSNKLRQKITLKKFVTHR